MESHYFTARGGHVVAPDEASAVSLLEAAGVSDYDTLHRCGPQEVVCWSGWTFRLADLVASGGSEVVRGMVRR